jgi:hypothetical protein
MTYVWLDSPNLTPGNPKWPCTGSWKGKPTTNQTTPGPNRVKPTTVHFEISCGQCDACFYSHNDLCEVKRWF